MGVEGKGGQGMWHMLPGGGCTVEQCVCVCVYAFVYVYVFVCGCVFVFFFGGRVSEVCVVTVLWFVAALPETLVCGSADAGL